MQTEEDKMREALGRCASLMATFVAIQHRDYAPLSNEVMMAEIQAGHIFSETERFAPEETAAARLEIREAQAANTERQRAKMSRNSDVVTGLF